MKPEGQREKEKGKASDYTAGLAEDAPIRPLHDCACYFIALTHSWLERITHFPFPIGRIIGYVEGSVDRWTHPLTHALECHSLTILASIDDKVISLIECCAPCSASQAKVALSQLYTQGPIGVSAGLWLKHEGVVKEDIMKAVCLANKVPLINLVTPILLSILSPSAKAISHWLLKEGERRTDKSTKCIDNSLVILKQEVGIEGQDVVGEESRQANLLIKLDACDVHYEGQNVSNVFDNEGCCEERSEIVGMNDDVLHAEEDTNVDDVLHLKEGMHADKVLVEQMDDNTEGIVEEEAFLAEREVSKDNLNVDKVGEKIGLSLVAAKGDDYLPDVLEMIESSWLLGKPALPKSTPTLSERRHASSSGFNIRRAFFNG